MRNEDGEGVLHCSMVRHSIRKCLIRANFHSFLYSILSWSNGTLSIECCRANVGSTKIMESQGIEHDSIECQMINGRSTREIYNGTVTMAEAKHGMYTMTQILRESKWLFEEIICPNQELNQVHSNYSELTSWLSNAPLTRTYFIWTVFKFHIFGQILNFKIIFKVSCYC